VCRLVRLQAKKDSIRKQRFFEKKPQKLLMTGGCGVAGAIARYLAEAFCFFFSKKQRLLCKNCNDFRRIRAHLRAGRAGPRDVSVYLFLARNLLRGREATRF
jgi:hypothetical protein